MKTTQSKRLTAHQCWRLSALAPVFLATALNAYGQGTIAYRHLSTPDNIPHVFPEDDQGMRVLADPSFPISVPLDLNNDGITDYTLEAGMHFSIYGNNGNKVLAFSPGFPEFSYRVIPLQAGDSISGASGEYEWTTENSVFTASRDSGIIGQPPLTIGYFTGVESAYAALQFQVNGDTYYGWMRVGAPYIGFNGGWVYDYAYETRPDTAILAGAVPEPSTIAFGVLGTLALILQTRFRK